MATKKTKKPKDYRQLRCELEVANKLERFRDRQKLRSFSEAIEDLLRLTKFSTPPA